MEVSTQPLDTADCSQEKETFMFVTQLSGKGQTNILIPKINPQEVLKTIEDEKLL